MHLVDNVHLVFTILWWDANLIDDAPNVLYAIVRGCIKLKHVEAPLGLFSGETIDGIGKNPGTGGFAHSAGTTKQIGLRNLTAFDAVAQRIGNRPLTHNGFPCGRSVLPRRHQE